MSRAPLLVTVIPQSFVTLIRNLRSTNKFGFHKGFEFVFGTLFFDLGASSQPIKGLSRSPYVLELLSSFLNNLCSKKAPIQSMGI
jgi:hypothetical protein